MLKFDYIKTGEFTYKVVDKKTREQVDLTKIITENFERGDYKK